MNISNLNNIPPYEVNNSLINESSEILPNLIQNANVTTDGYFGLGIMVILFIFLMIILMADQEVFRFRFIEALVASSGIVLLLGLVAIITNIFSSFQHVVWFGVIFIIALLLKFYNQN